MAGVVMEKKVSSRELRRAYQQHAEDLKAFTGAAAQDLTALQADLKATRELCADLSERLDATRRDVGQLKGSLALFITQRVPDRIRWLLGRVDES